MPRWEFLLTDRYGVPIAELKDATARQVVLPLNRVPTGTYTLQTNNWLCGPSRLADQTMVKAYRDDVLMAQGPIMPGYNKSVGDAAKTLQANWSGIGVRLAYRMIPSSKSSVGLRYGDPNDPSSYSDRGVLARTFLNEIIEESPPPGVLQSVMDPGFRVGTIGLSSATAVGPWIYKNALQAIGDLSTALLGFDWEIAPCEPVVDAWGIQFGTFNCALPIGGVKPDVVWEYGDGKRNVASFTETVDFTGALARAYSLPSALGQDAAATVIESSISADLLHAYGTMYEDVIQDDSVVPDMRQRLLEETIDVRRRPKTIITFQPTVSQEDGVVPQYGTDYKIGDIFQFRAVEYGVETINALFRCYQVTFDIDDNGNEIATPTLVSQ